FCCRLLRQPPFNGHNWPIGSPPSCNVYRDGPARLLNRADLLIDRHFKAPEVAVRRLTGSRRQSAKLTRHRPGFFLATVVASTNSTASYAFGATMSPINA